MTTNYTKRPFIIPKGRKTFQMVFKYNNILHSEEFNQNWDFWFEKKHLATLRNIRSAIKILQHSRTYA
jgi:hypothetical protein